MICVGIDVAKDKYDCFILSSEGEVLADVFTIPNNAEGFDTLLQTIRRCARPEDKIKAGLEATGHYSYNILGFLLNEGLDTYVINPLHTNLYRKSLSLRKTKTDRVDARTIAAMLMSDVDLKSYTDTVYHNEELKSLTRYRFDKVGLVTAFGLCLRTSQRISWRQTDFQHAHDAFESSFEKRFSRPLWPGDGRDHSECGTLLSRLCHARQVS